MHDTGPHPMNPKPQPPECMNDFIYPTGQDFITSGSFLDNDTRLISAMKFACRGAISQVRMVSASIGRDQHQQLRIKLKVWRRDIRTEPEIYHTELGQEIDLPAMCKGEKFNVVPDKKFGDLGMVYQCHLNKVTILVEPGYALEIEPNNIELLYFNKSGLRSYTFKQNSSTTINVSNSIRNYTVQPLINVDIKGIITILFILVM